MDQELKRPTRARFSEDSADLVLLERVQRKEAHLKVALRKV
jgi:hypothetical protein